MQHVYAIEDIALHNTWLTIGVFDGVHLGHQALIQSMVEAAHAEGSPAVVLTFDPHPVRVLRPGVPLAFLTSPEERASHLAGLGVDVVITLPFTPEVAKLPALTFVEAISHHLGMRRLWVGHDFALGRNREGDLPALQKYGETLEYSVDIFPPVLQETVRISSSRIRTLLKEGQIRLANQMLGYRYALTALIVEGDQRGRTIGIPTANMQLLPDKLVPQVGVYACLATIIEGDQPAGTWQAVTNIGVRPTFEGSGSLSVETHLLDFSASLYGKVLHLEFVERLRDEQRFSGVDALVAQIHEDIRQARTLLASEVH